MLTSNRSLKRIVHVGPKLPFVKEARESKNVPMKHLFYHEVTLSLDERMKRKEEAMQAVHRIQSKFQNLIDQPCFTQKVKQEAKRK